MRWKIERRIGKGLGLGLERKNAREREMRVRWIVREGRQNQTSKLTKH